MRRGWGIAKSLAWLQCQGLAGEHRKESLGLDFGGLKYQVIEFSLYTENKLEAKEKSLLSL